MLPDSLRLAVGTLTALPVPAPRRVDRRVAGLAMLLAPLAAMVVAAAAAGALLLADLVHLPALVSATLSVAAAAVASKGLHLDGLADTADGLATQQRERALTVMRQGDVGPAAVVTVVLVLLLQVGSLAEVLADRGAATAAVGMGAAVVSGRTSLAVACARGVPAARDEGLGAAVAGSVPRPAAVISVAFAATVGGLLIGWVAVAAVGVASVVTVVLLRRCVRRLGGTTGDVLGACVEAAVTAYLLTLAAGTPRLP